MVLPELAGSTGINLDSLGVIVPDVLDELMEGVVSSVDNSGVSSAVGALEDGHGVAPVGFESHLGDSVVPGANPFGVEGSSDFKGLPNFSASGAVSMLAESSFHSLSNPEGGDSIVPVEGRVLRLLQAVSADV
mmetsp:Transcript_26441/g.23369  ORF Transcript_26441/g.23369 Transcript_26441/m.23369 type:complete len:133 (-) Transcript_26441:141-539(-)